MRFLDGSNFEKILRKTWTRGTWPEAIIHHTDRDWQAKIILWKGLASFHPNVINVFFFHFCMFFLNSGANTVDRGHVRRASWDPYTIGHLWRGGSCEGPNAVRFFALRYGGLQGGLVKIKLQSCNRWICGWSVWPCKWKLLSSCGTVYYAVQGGSNFWVWGWNPWVWPFKWKLLSSTFLWYCLLCCTRWF